MKHLTTLLALAAFITPTTTLAEERVEHYEAKDIKIQQAVEAASDTTKTEHTIIIKDHKFTPDLLRVPAGEKIKLIVDNQDSTPEEFESDDLRREKIIAGNTKATVYVGPMKPGKYHFFGEFNLDTANGYIIAE